MNIKEIKELILAIDKSSINKFDVEIDGFKLSMEKEICSKEVTKITYAKEELTTEETQNDLPQENYKSSEDLYVVTAPLIGTYYSSPNPNSPEYVKIGTKIKKGDTLCILEAMKLMNEIQSDVDGEIVEILVKNEDLVEYNQALFKVKVD